MWDPCVSSIYPRMMKAIYDKTNKQRFAPFRDWCSEVVVPVIVHQWIKEDLCYTVCSVLFLCSVNLFIFKYVLILSSRTIRRSRGLCFKENKEVY